jgi:hypothetical protein
MKRPSENLMVSEIAGVVAIDSLLYILLIRIGEKFKVSMLLLRINFLWWSRETTPTRGRRGVWGEEFFFY